MSERVPVIGAGADGIAVVSAVCAAASPRSAAELLARDVARARMAHRHGEQAE